MDAGKLEWAEQHLEALKRQLGREDPEWPGLNGCGAENGGKRARK